MFTKYAMINS